MDLLFGGISVKRSFFFLVALALALGGSMQRVEAASIAAFTGSVFLTEPGNVDGTVNYAVYDHTTGSAVGDYWGTGNGVLFDASFVASLLSPALDNGALTGARYLYLYQTVNNGPATAVEISQNTASIVPANLTSWGYFVLGGGTVAPLVSKGPSSLKATYDPNTGLTDGQSSLWWGYTSNVAPVWGSTSIQDGGRSVDGAAPQAAPEPASVVMLGIGISGMFGYGWRRRKVALAA